MQSMQFLDQQPKRPRALNSKKNNDNMENIYVSSPISTIMNDPFRVKNASIISNTPIDRQGTNLIPDGVVFNTAWPPRELKRDFEDALTNRRNNLNYSLAAEITSDSGVLNSRIYSNNHDNCTGSYSTTLSLNIQAASNRVPSRPGAQNILTPRKKGF